MYEIFDLLAHDSSTACSCPALVTASLAGAMVTGVGAPLATVSTAPCAAGGCGVGDLEGDLELPAPLPWPFGPCEGRYKSQLMARFSYQPRLVAHGLTHSVYGLTHYESAMIKLFIN